MTAVTETSVEVVIVRTGLANLASWVAAFERLGVQSVITDDRETIERAALLVLPGVGAAGAAMETLHAHSLVEPILRRLQAGSPTLAVCLGLQLLANESEETAGVRLLGLVDGHVQRFGAGKPVPQMGWNQISVDATADAGVQDCMLADGCAYFANSFALKTSPAGWRCAWSSYGGERFIAAMERGRVLACQFHPELSGPWGLSLLNRWLSGSTMRTVGSVKQSSNGRYSLHDSLRPRVIPCLDVRDGRVVKGIKFQGLRDAGDPVECARRYEADGADELVILDVSATTEGRNAAVRTVDAVRRAISIPLTVGGGVRTTADAARLLDAGADKVGVNSAAVADPQLLRVLSDRFGRQCVVAAIDAARRIDGAPGWQVVTHAGTKRVELDAVAWCAQVAELGAGEILLTSWDRDGTRSGYDLELLRAARAAAGVPLIASGGAAGVDHLVDAFEAGADAVLAASIFHDQETTVRDVKHSLVARGIPVRTDPDTGRQDTGGQDAGVQSTGVSDQANAEGATHARAID